MAVCIHCTGLCRLSSGKEVYPYAPHLHKKPIWICDRCKSRVGCHPGGNEPLGFAANAELRNARIKVHSVLDPLWKGKGKRMRSAVYAYLSEQMGIDREDTHTAMFDIEDCRKAWAILKRTSTEQILEWRKHRKAA